MSAAQTNSSACLTANRANAQLSTGPKTEFGKSKASLNAVKTGLTGRTVLLPTEDAQAYEDHILRCVETFEPVGECETRLVQNLADTQWRLDRIPGLEHAIFALGRIRYAEMFPEDMDPRTRAGLIDAHILDVEAKKLKNLHLQESRLRRYYRQDLQELQSRQKERKEHEAAKTKTKAAVAKPDGFEFAASGTTPETPEPAPVHTSQPADPSGAARPRQQ